MEKENKIIIFVIVLVMFLIAGWQTGFFANIFSGPVKSVAIPEGIILFYGEGCPHCKNVDDYISQNKIEDKVKFTRLEVWYNKNNQVILGKVAQKCSINSNQVGVPFLYDGVGKCYVGEVEVIDFFKTQAGTQ